MKTALSDPMAGNYWIYAPGAYISLLPYYNMLLCTSKVKVSNGLLIFSNPLLVTCV